MTAQMTWLHGDVEASKGEEAACLPLSALRQLGWTVVAGASCALLSPLGVLSVPPPAGGRWSVSNCTMQLLPRLQLSIMGTIWCIQVTLIRFLGSGLLLAFGDDPHVARWVDVISHLLFLLKNLLFLLLLVRFDVGLLCRHRFWPLPILIFNRPLYNAIVTLLTLLMLVGQSLATLSVELSPGGTSEAYETDGLALAVVVASGLESLTSALLLLYLVATITTTLVYSSFLRESVWEGVVG